MRFSCADRSAACKNSARHTNKHTAHCQMRAKHQVAGLLSSAQKRPPRLPMVMCMVAKQGAVATGRRARSALAVSPTHPIGRTGRGAGAVATKDDAAAASRGGRVRDARVLAARAVRRRAVGAKHNGGLAAWWCHGAPSGKGASCGGIRHARDSALITGWYGAWLLQPSQRECGTDEDGWSSLPNPTPALQATARPYALQCLLTCSVHASHFPLVVLRWCLKRRLRG
jgi:hypothetical protein